MEYGLWFNWAKMDGDGTKSVGHGGAGKLGDGIQQTSRFTSGKFLFSIRSNSGWYLELNLASGYVQSIFFHQITDGSPTVGNLGCILRIKLM